jgi:hypothetical protein
MFQILPQKRKAAQSATPQETGGEDETEQVSTSDVAGRPRTFRRLLVKYGMPCLIAAGFSLSAFVYVLTRSISVAYIYLVVLFIMSIWYALKNSYK